MFEISIVQRDKLGNPILNGDGGVRRKIFTAQNGAELSDIWGRNGYRGKAKRDKRVQNRKDTPD